MRGKVREWKVVSELDRTVKAHVEYYRDAPERVSRKSIISDLRKDSQYWRFVEELALNPEHELVHKQFARLAWDVVRRYLSTAEGWWAKSRGRGCEFVHQTWAKPEEWRDVINYRIVQRDEDQGKLNLAIELGETRCILDDYVLDRIYDGDGKLLRVEVWSRS